MDELAAASIIADLSESEMTPEQIAWENSTIESAQALNKRYKDGILKQLNVVEISKNIMKEFSREKAMQDVEDAYAREQEEMESWKKHLLSVKKVSDQEQQATRDEKLETIARATGVNKEDIPVRINFCVVFLGDYFLAKRLTFLFRRSPM
jgi:hypothetical protein